MSSPVWWGQLVRSTALRQAGCLRDVVQEWLDDLGESISENDLRLVWTEGATAPTALSIQTLLPLNLNDLLEKIQPYLGDEEFMIFAEMAEKDTYDRGCIMYRMVSRYCIGQFSGDEITKRVERVALHMHEELEKPLDTEGVTP